MYAMIDEMHRPGAPHLGFNERKLLTLDYFASRQWVRPKVYAVALGIYPTRASYSYLKRLQRWGLLWRGRDITGHVVYHLSPRGAQRLIWKKVIRSSA
jgi:hypothetical protein